MRVYVDPKLYMFSDHDWISMAFVDRLSSLVDFLSRIKMQEEHSFTAQFKIPFQFSDMLLEHIFNSNPSLNVPPRPHYFHQFKHSILPELLRRAQSCPANLCQPMAAQAVAAVPANGNEVGDLLFADHLDACLRCSRSDAKCLIRGAVGSIANEAQVFQLNVPVDLADYNNLLEPFELLPAFDDADRLARLNQVALSYAKRAALSNAQWIPRTVARIEVSDEFWSTYNKAGFPHDPVYGQRLCAVLGQVSAGLDIDISAHGMAPQKFLYGSKQLNKWNAYVFQMGPNPQDQRCSRLYYGRSDGKVVLHRFEPDAH